MKKIIGSGLRSIFQFCTRKIVIKLILLFTSIIFLVIGVLTIISYKMLEKESRNSILEASTNNLKLVNKSVRKYFDEISQFTAPQYRYDPIMNALRNESNDHSSMAYLEDYLRVLFYSRTDVEAIYLYLINEEKVYSLSRDDVAVKSTYNASIPSQYWFGQAVKDKKNRYIQPLLLSRDTGYSQLGEESFFVFHRVLRNLVDRNPRAILSVVLNSSYRDEMIKDSPLTEGAELLLLDANLVPYYGNSQKALNHLNDMAFRDRLNDLQEGHFTWSDGSEKYMVIVDVEEQAGWRMIKLIPFDEIYKAARMNRDLSYSIGAVILSISILLNMLTANAITKPIKLLANKMRRFSEGAFDVEVKVRGSDEIAYLSNQFNLMAMRTSKLINEKYHMKLVQNNAILKALEAEINPHFLYNALQAISTKALKSGENEIRKMVDALALTLRYCIRGKEFVLLREEIQHIENYMLIQKARFGKRLHIAYDLDESLYEVKILRLTLQSLVENSVKHAVEKITSPVTIVISAHSNDRHTIIRVTDNGPGMKRERLMQVRGSLREKWEERQQENESIGLKNVNTRLQILYGEEYGIEINSDESGTDTCMIIPRAGGEPNV
ncbi:sensor histidine kinase [Cohnella terricola]|uniref:Sensor histidine kinase n=1 Tax=Cohnella terricola TaxID=1289167 RepID=A0A559JWJ6_9BACL|nr:sensor histidine kinase [Cohnella terricola]TVY04262.1 sensor histidine kinase [Cohnella terricola]